MWGPWPSRVAVAFLSSLHPPLPAPHALRRRQWLCTYSVRACPAGSRACLDSAPCLSEWEGEAVNSKPAHDSESRFHRSAEEEEEQQVRICCSQTPQARLKSLPTTHGCAVRLLCLFSNWAALSSGVSPTCVHVVVSLWHVPAQLHHRPAIPVPGQKALKCTWQGSRCYADRVCTRPWFVHWITACPLWWRIFTSDGCTGS